MNLPRIVNGGVMFLDKLKVFRGVRFAYLDTPRCAFSSFCNNNKLLDSTKLALTPSNSSIISSRGLKVRGHLQLRCKDCYFERKDGIMYVTCSSYPRHNQRQLTKRPKYTWILTYCFQTKKRPW